MSTFWVRRDRDGVEWVRQDVEAALSFAFAATCFLASVAWVSSGAIYLVVSGGDGVLGFLAFVSTLFGTAAALLSSCSAAGFALEWRRDWLRRSTSTMGWTTAWWGQVLIAWASGNYLVERKP